MQFLFPDQKFGRELQEDMELDECEQVIIESRMIMVKKTAMIHHVKSHAVFAKFLVILGISGF